jgi:hypothetical protein
MARLDYASTSRSERTQVLHFIVLNAISIIPVRGLEEEFALVYPLELMSSPGRSRMICRKVQVRTG